MADHAPEYDPRCVTCRRASGKADAGVTTECRWHQVARLTRERDEAQRLHAAALRDSEEADAEITRLRALLRKGYELHWRSCDDDVDCTHEDCRWQREASAALEGRDE